MATQVAAPIATSARGALKLELAAEFPNLRALAWDGDLLYASRGYELLAARADLARMEWRTVGRYRPEWWRNLSCRNRLSFRLVRDGFHGVAILPQGNIVAAVPGAIATLRAGESEFRVTHRLTRGTRPLHITATPDGRVFWGEYFDNPQRDEVHIYVSRDQGLTWEVAHRFGRGSIRHVHNILFDRRENCLWIFTGDYGAECRILRASLDFKTVDEVAGGSQQTRAVAAVVHEDGLYFASDTPLERNFIYFLSRRGRLARIGELPSSSIYACRNRGGMFFSTMVEPSEVNPSQSVSVFGSGDGAEWEWLAGWKKDGWSMKFFQYGNAFLPDGENATDLLAVSTIAVEGADLQTSIWRTVDGGGVP
jgi:hypothetical protein